jgi:hypothetical protein
MTELRKYVDLVRGILRVVFARRVPQGDGARLGFPSRGKGRSHNEMLMSDDDRSKAREVASNARNQGQLTQPRGVVNQAKSELRHQVRRLVNAVQGLARRRPGAYLLVCAAAGFAVVTAFLSAVSAAWSMSRTLRGVGLERSDSSGRDGQTRKA